METLVRTKPTDRYTDLCRRIDRLEIDEPVAAVSPEQAESLRLVIERLEALDKLVARQSEI